MVGMQKALAVAAAILFMAGTARADNLAGTSEGWRAWLGGAAIEDMAERAIILGGVVLYRYRHTVAGIGLGCAAGAMLGATSAVAAGAATSGAALVVTPEAIALGCTAGAAAGAALGYPLDHIYE